MYSVETRRSWPPNAHLRAVENAASAITASDTLIVHSIPANSGYTCDSTICSDRLVRWYDPVTGRWTAKDPIGINGGLNQYVFCGNNPVNFRDPLGLCRDGDAYVAQYVEDLRHDALTMPFHPLQWSWGTTSSGEGRDLRFGPDVLYGYDRLDAPVKADVAGNINAAYGLAEVYGPLPAVAMVVIAEIKTWESWDAAKGSWAANYTGLELWAADHPLASTVGGQLLTMPLFYLHTSAEVLAGMTYGGGRR